MLQLSELSKAYGGRTLFSEVSLQLNRGDRLGLVGPNGAGKTTLFSIILGENSPDDGKVLWEKSASFGYLPQESAPVGDETVMSLALNRRMGLKAEGGVMDADDHAWELEPKAKTILRGLAFRESDFDRPAHTLSGGWVMRAHLARLLTQEPDLLMLDEPTNHLDLDSLLWFQDYLQNRYLGAILMISHDREFLNSLVHGIIELAHQKLNRYRGNYDAYVIESEQREILHTAAYENQQREINRLQTLADRFRAKASKAGMAQSKLKQIDRMEKIEAPLNAEKKVAFRFPGCARSGQRVIALKGVDFAYGTLPVYRGLDFEAERGQRLVLVGPNGAGKSTLLKLLANVIAPQAGTCELGHNVTAGYFSQYRGEMFDPKRSVLEESLDINPRPAEQLARNLLGAFLFRGDDVYKSVSVLSGGEKTRLALCKMLLNPPNLLLMDEPTTHLDIGSIDALISALKTYEGTLIFISHDVHFIRQIAQHVIHISAGILTPYAGDYQYYLDKTGSLNARAALTAGDKLTDARPEAAAASGAGTQKIFLTREEKKALNLQKEAAAKVKREKRVAIEAMEKEVEKCEARIVTLTKDLERPETYADGGKAQRINRDLLRAQDDLRNLTYAWEQAQEAFEAEYPEKAS
jgi:ATP-binding cassette, subfamily F, member 3